MTGWIIDVARKPGWENKASPEVVSLVKRMYGFSALFKDMLLKPGTDTSTLVSTPEQKADGTWKNRYMKTPYELENFGSSWNFVESGVALEVMSAGQLHQHGQEVPYSVGAQDAFIPWFMEREIRPKSKLLTRI